MPAIGDSWARCRTLACGRIDITASGTLDGYNADSAVKFAKTDAAFKMTGLIVAPGVSPMGSPADCGYAALR